MKRLLNVLASVALATALVPIAANATTMTSLDYVRIATHKAIFGPLPEVQHVASCDAAAPRQWNDIVVSSGDWWANQRYPESFGG